MKRYSKLFSIAITAFCLGLMANSSLAQEPSGRYHGMGSGMMGENMMDLHTQGYEMGHSMMRGYGMGPFIMGWGNFIGMDLSADQKSKIKQIRKDARAKHWALMGEMFEAYDKKRELYEADKLDPIAINNQHKKIEDLRAQRRTVSIDAYNQINNILTKEQREKSRRWGRGYRYMMWGY